MAKHKCVIPDPPADTTRWMGTYGDMVTLLMAFFVMLFAVSETNNEKFIAFVAGLAGPFDNPALELGIVDGAALPETSVSPISLVAPQPGYRDEFSQQTLDEVSAQEAAREQLAEVETALEEVLEVTDVPITAEIRADARGLVVSISTDHVLFEVGAAEISAAGRQLIAEIAPVLVGAPNSVVIEGHTDDTPLSAGGDTNWNLSTDRAVAVLELLGTEHGMPWDRISASGYGEHRPLAPNTSPANRAVNRRVEILVVGLDIADDGAPPPPADAVTSEASTTTPPVEVVTGVVEDPIGDPVADATATGDPVAQAAAGAVAGGPTLAAILGQ